MQDFYTLTGMKLAIFDSDYRELFCYPAAHCLFCGLMQSHPTAYVQCMDSNRRSFEHCKKSGELQIYRCHAGLVEATAPLIDNGVIIGYIMFGQVSDIPDTAERLQQLMEVCRMYAIAEDIQQEACTAISYKSEQQIKAAAKILEACTFYVLLKGLIYFEKQQFLNKLNAYIDKHITEDISVNSICEALCIGRSKLYEISSQYLGIGIAEYIKQQRLAKARELLINSDDSVSGIAQAVGFADYNYFCRVFKAEAGLPAKRYRELHR